MMRAMSRRTSLFGALISSGFAIYADVPLTLLPADTVGRCMDGSPGGFYLDSASAAESASKWVFMFEGGGECTDAEFCRERAKDAHGSSKFFADTLAAKSPRLWYASADPEENPAMHDWNRVFLAYCSQDMWSGTRREAMNETFGMFFSGHVIVEEIVRHLVDVENFGAATEVVIAGESAGGFGAWLNAGYIQDHLPASAKVTIAPIGGMYGFAYPYLGPGHVEAYYSDFTEQGWPGNVALWQSHMDHRCTSAMPDRPWACMVSNVSAPHIPLPLFIVEAQTDKVQLEGHDNMPKKPWNSPPAGSDERLAYMDDWRANMTYALRSSLKDGDGYFFPACYVHTVFTKAAPLILHPNSGQSLSYGQAFAEWYGGGAQHFEDTCGLLCGQCTALSDVVV